MTSTPPTAECDRFYCIAPADPALSDARCVLHSEDPNKHVASMAAAIATIRTTGSASCRGWVFPERVVLREMALGLADFRDATFQRGADFERSSFRGASMFGRARFREDAVFTETDFADPPLLGKVEFSETKFEGRASFFLARFDEVDFRSCHFLGEAVFDRAVARRLTFTGTEFHGHARFRELSASDGIAFVQTSMLGDADCDRTDMSRVSFSFCEARRLSLSRAARLSAAEFHAMRWSRNGTAEEQRALTSKDVARYRDAERVYRELRRGAEERRQYVDADWAYRRELEMRRLSYRLAGPLWWGALRASVASLEALYRLCSDYGSSLLRPVIALLIWLFALFPYAVAWQHVTISGTLYTLDPVTSPAESLEAYWKLATLGLRTAVLLPEPAAVELSSGAGVVVALTRIAAPFFALLFSVAVRRQLRR